MRNSCRAECGPIQWNNRGSHGDFLWEKLLWESSNLKPLVTVLPAICSSLLKQYFSRATRLAESVPWAVTFTQFFPERRVVAGIRLHPFKFAPNPSLLTRPSTKLGISLQLRKLGPFRGRGHLPAGS